MLSIRPTPARAPLQDASAGKLETTSQLG